MCNEDLVENLVENFPVQEWIEGTLYTDSDIPFDDEMIYDNNEAITLTEIEGNEDHPALLCTVNSHIEAITTESLLRSNNIPFMKKWRNGSDATIIYMGVSYNGADIYVPFRYLESARALMDLPYDAEKEDSENFDSIQKELDSDKNGTKSTLMLIIVALLPAIFFILFVRMILG